VDSKGLKEWRLFPTSNQLAAGLAGPGKGSRWSTPRDVHSTQVGTDDPQEGEEYAKQEGHGHEQREPARGRPAINQYPDDLRHAEDEAESRDAEGADHGELERQNREAGEVRDPKLDKVRAGDAFDRNSPPYLEWVQRSLNELSGANLAVDGESGPATQGAVRRFQQEHGLKQSGRVDESTEAALLAAGAAPAPTMPAITAVGIDFNADLRPSLSCWRTAQWRGCP
jgi:hypothetical protein